MVFVISTHFRTTLRQDVLLRELLPLSEHSLKKTIKEITPEHGRYAEDNDNVSKISQNNNFEYLVEPTPQIVLESLTRYLTEMLVYHLVLEANASEHSARMVAMKNATDNAKEKARQYTRTFNKVRQAAITREISEITSGIEAMR